MPNYCSNALKVTGPGNEAFIERALKAVGLFQEFYPMPDALVGRTWMSDGKDYFMPESERPEGSKDLWGWWPEDREQWLYTPEMQRANTEKYGAKDWYDWHCEYWGTKWDTQATQVEDSLLFRTAWSPPKPWLIKVSQDFPDLVFHLAYVEIGMEVYGELMVRNGGDVWENTDDSDLFWETTPDWDRLDQVWDEKGEVAYYQERNSHLSPRLKQLLSDYHITDLGG